MKKVGLAVCYDTKNFGSQLQVLATIKKIESLGYKTEIIRYKKKISPTFIFQTLPRFLNPYFLKSKIGISNIKRKIFLGKNKAINQEIIKRNDRFNMFVKNNFMNLSEYYSGWENLVKDSNKKYDIFLCGSDQLWLPGNLGSHFYTLEFVDNSKKKIAYATSFGVSKIPWFQYFSTKKYLNRINYLSSREIKGVEIIKKLTGRSSQLVCDPTLLLTSNEWDKIIENKKIIKEKYIFCYFLGTNNEHRNIAEELKKKTGYKIVSIPFLDNYVERDKSFGDYKMYDVDAFDFVNLIKNAEYVLTDSFHGTVFSILNHKKFIVMDRFSNNSKNSRNSRIDSLCATLCLSQRRYKKNIFNSIKTEIDYELVEKKLSKLREDSIEYLKKSLK